MENLNLEFESEKAIESSKYILSMGLNALKTMNEVSL